MSCCFVPHFTIRFAPAPRGTVHLNNDTIAHDPKPKVAPLTTYLAAATMNLVYTPRERSYYILLNHPLR
ncbi:hypothetical protein BC349_19645 [Flavihumibacter stibioxidans]|uniref:Uncharacterized protein n=1 Tax=Flavihumibacter stibioxidans TaxID=1834163 RepID=A0ABR7M6S6_9BACT|nr:hypothetical protein [Flavihumibacter stibioxidans]